MSREYDSYLQEHKENVARAFCWIRDNLPELIIDIPGVDYEHQICFGHDASKFDPEEYDAYDRYFYGGNRSYEVVQIFNYAWLRHIHLNKHHWQHWILQNDDPELGEMVLDMPYEYVIEMICDWMSFSISKNEPREVFNFWKDNKDHIKLSDKTRKTVIEILMAIADKLDEIEGVAEE